MLLLKVSSKLPQHYFYITFEYMHDTLIWPTMFFIPPDDAKYMREPTSITLPGGPDDNDLYGGSSFIRPTTCSSAITPKDIEAGLIMEDGSAIFRSQSDLKSKSSDRYEGMLLGGRQFSYFRHIHLVHVMEFFLIWCGKTAYIRMHISYFFQ